MKIVATGFIAVLFVAVAIIGFVSFVKLMSAITSAQAVSVQTIEKEGRRYLIVTSDHGVAVCPVTP